MYSRIKLILILIPLFFIGREFAPIDLSYYEKYSTISATTDLSVSKSRTPSLLADSLDLTIRVNNYDVFIEGVDQPSNHPFMRTSFSLYQVKGQFTTEVSNERYMPFYKNFTYTGSLKMKMSEAIHVNGVDYTIHLLGDINLEGSMVIDGLCSGKKAKELAENELKAKVKNIIVEKLRNELNHWE